MPAERPIVIAGGGLAAVRTAQALRSQKHAGPIVLLCAEDEAPYDRPPLSKKYLLGEAGDDDIRLLKEDKLADLDLDLRLGCPATGLDRDARSVQTADGEVGYETLVVATGAGAATLPFLREGSNVHVLRSVDDARRLRDALSEGARVGIVGGGFIGLEIAGVSVQRGCDVTVLEAAEAPLAPVMGGELGGHVQRWHEARGVGFRCGSALTAAHGEGQVDERELADGERIGVDVVVVGVGVRRHTGWLSGSGLELHDGLVCDEHGRTADPHVFGVGDVVAVRTPEGHLHLTGHWTATTEQARRAAKAIVGEEDPGPIVHDFYFWSDQHDKRLQFVGEVPEEPVVTFTVGGPEEDTYVAVLSDGEHLTGVFSLGRPKDFIKASMPLRQGEKVPAPSG